VRALPGNPACTPIAILPPQQRESKERNEDVHVENYTGIAWREIMGCHHLVDVTHGSAKRKDAGANHCDKTAVEAGKRGNEAGDREPQARRAYLELEGAVSPADKRRRDLAEEHVEDEVDERHDANTEQNVPGEELVNPARRWWQDHEPEGGFFSGVRGKTVHIAGNGEVERAIGGGKTSLAGLRVVMGLDRQASAQSLM
jgi:hypothetical protein